MPFCYSPWTNLDISPTGDISPCCKFRHEHYTAPVFNIIDHSIGDYLGSAVLDQIKQEFAAGKWPTGCERCRIEEQAGIDSKRQLDHQRWHTHYNNYDLESQEFLTASVGFGNICNLACITCGPQSSSRWQQEHKKIYNIDIRPNHFYKTGFVEEFVAQAPGLIHIDIPGGEPLLSGVAQQKQLLSAYVASGQSANMTLHYTTNATLFPDKSWWALWDNFAEIDLQISMDGIGDRYEYIRYPAVWTDVVNNIHRYQDYQSAKHNLRLSVSHTVSAYNILYLDEFFTWCQDQNLPTPWCGRVHNPAHMRPTVWPDPARQYIIDHLKNSHHPDILAWINLLSTTDDSIMFNEFQQRLVQHDQYRALDFKITFPELAKYL